MAENTEKKVLIDVEIKAKEALETYAKLKIKVDELKSAQADLKKQMSEVDTSTEEGRKQQEQLRIEYERVGQEIKAYNKEAQVQQKEIQKNIELQNQQAGSIDALKAKLSLKTAEYNKLSEAERKNTKDGKDLKKEISETTAALKKEEEALGNHHRSVGDYAKAGKALKAEMKELANSMAAMVDAGEKNNEEYKTALERLGELKSALGQVNAEANVAHLCDKYKIGRTKFFELINCFNTEI